MYWPHSPGLAARAERLSGTVIAASAAHSLIRRIGSSISVEADCVPALRRPLLPAARPTLLLLKELLCIGHGVSCGHRADKRGRGDKRRHEYRQVLRRGHLHGFVLSIPQTGWRMSNLTAGLARTVA